MASQQNGSAESAQRLSSWKEIANCLGRSVRTVQRWEKELGLPVHRIRGRGAEIIFAYTNEIDQWQKANEAKGVALSNGDAVLEQSEQGSTPHSRRMRLAWLGGTTAVLVLAGGLTWWRVSATSREPASLSIADNRLLVLDASGRQLWEHRFDFVIDPRAHQGDYAVSGRSRAAIEDLDADGQREVVFLASSADNSLRELGCFDRDGKRRFTLSQGRSVQFGDDQYFPPYLPHAFLLAPEPQGSKSLWLFSLHNLYFPSVLHRINPRGETTAEYWSNGHITALRDAVIAGRRTLLVAAYNNEHAGASLAALDYEHPSGAAPASIPKYRCRNCPPGQPSAFLIFPRMDISQAMNTRPLLSDIQVQPNGQIRIAVDHVAGKDTESIAGIVPGVLYTFDSRLRLIGIEITDNYRRAHARLELLGQIKHRFGDQDERDAAAVLQWQGDRFAPVKDD